MQRYLYGFCQEGLDQGCVSFVQGWEDEAWYGRYGQDVGWVEGAAEEEAAGVVERGYDAGNGAVISVGKVLGEVGHECVFVFDLVRVRVVSRREK